MDRHRAAPASVALPRSGDGVGHGVATAEHFPEKACPGPDPGWTPVFRRKCDQASKQQEGNVVTAQNVELGLALPAQAPLSAAGGSRRAIIAATVGNMLETYDFAVY